MGNLRKRLGIWLLRPYLQRRLMGNAQKHLAVPEEYSPEWRERYWMGRITEVDSIMRGREVVIV